MMIVFMLLLMVDDKRPVEATYGSDPASIRAEIAKQGVRQGMAVCDESQSQIVLCEKWHERVVMRYRIVRRFTFAGSTVLASVESCTDARGPNGQQTGRCETLGGKYRTGLIVFLENVRTELK